jgi:hypothetical protein
MKNQGYWVVAANMSIGANVGWPSDCSASSGQYAAAFAALRNAQILPVVSAGNAAGGGTVNYGVSMPGCVTSALTVGATYDASVGTKGWNETPYCTDSTTWADKVTCFSQTGPGLDMLAPGSEIYGAGGTWTGTSQAAPHVAGAVAVLAAAKTSANIDQIESALVTSGPLVSDSRYGVTITVHRLDLYSAVSTLLGSGSTDPAMGAVTEQFPVNQQLTSTTIPIEFDYSATDPSGISAYDVWLSTDGGQYIEQTNLPALTTSVWVTASLGHKYQLAVRAKNGNGVWSGYQYSNALTASATDDKALSITSPWAFYSLSDTYGGTYSATSASGASMYLNFTGRDAAVIAPEFSSAGLSTLYCDGTASATIDEYSASTIGRRIVGWCRFTQSGQHTIKVVNQATAGRPWLAVDAFAVLS